MTTDRPKNTIAHGKFILRMHINPFPTILCENCCCKSIHHLYFFLQKRKTCGEKYWEMSRSQVSFYHLIHAKKSHLLII